MMNTQFVLKEIEEIIQTVKDHASKNLNHVTDCDFFLNKYSYFKKSIADNNLKEINEFIYWNKWYAPRIVYDGIGNKKLIGLIEKLNSMFDGKERTI
ncbi:MAG: hypothetical protein J0M08_07980 [Bacteroidetes bacterium]|nr:hypothetical protein [Bacteroidota bacterium]